MAYEAEAAPPFDSGSVSVNSGEPVAAALSYNRKLTVPVGWAPPETVAWSAIEEPTVADEGCCVVEIEGVGLVTLTGSSAGPEEAVLLLTSPL